MAEGTAIEWADDSWNPFRARNRETGVVGHFCVKISPGCKNCYAERLQTWPIGSGIRYAAQDLPKVELFLDEAVLEQPLRRKRGRDIFPCSMTDIFLEHYPDEWIARMFDVMYRARQHRFLVLTKRAERMRDFIIGRHGAGNNAFAFANVWFGISAENQEEWDARAPFVDEMTRLGFNTWASFEPLLGEVNLRLWRVLWAVVGGESGARARPMQLSWARYSRDQCKATGTAFFLKQLGRYPLSDRDEGYPWAQLYDGDHQPINEWGLDGRSAKGGDPAEWPADLRVREYPGA